MGLGHRAGVRIRPGRRHFTAGTKAPSQGGPAESPADLPATLPAYDHCNEQQQGSEDTGADLKPEGWAISQEAAPSDQVTKYWVWTPPPESQSWLVSTRLSSCRKPTEEARNNSRATPQKLLLTFPFPGPSPALPEAQGRAGAPRTSDSAEANHLYFRAPRTS